MQKTTSLLGIIPILSLKKFKTWFLKSAFQKSQKKPSIINPLAVAYNKNDKPRLVLDCRYINKKLRTFKFKYGDMQFARMLFEKGTYMFGFDIRGAYNHIDIFPEPASVAQLDARPTGDQEVAVSTPAEVGNIFS